MNLVEIVLTINFPIFLGWIFKQLKLFPDNESAVLRKFVIKVTVPFLIFRNLYNADTHEFSQMLPMIMSLCLMLVFSAFIVVSMRNLSSSDKKISNSFCLGSFVGNYSYLGWGVLSYFYGIKIPEWLAKSIGSIANITIPAILFTVGLSLSVMLKKDTVRPVVLGTFFRTIFGMIIGTVVLSIVSFCFKDIDITTKKVILMESVMPSAALSPFFADFVDSDKEVVSGIVTFSTLFSLVTLPFWYFMIEKWSFIQ